MSEGHRLPSGLYVVETPPGSPPAPPELRGMKCADCGRRSVDDGPPPLQSRTSDGWHLHSPCCKCGTYARCPDCEGKEHGCPQCGEPWEYT